MTNQQSFIYNFLLAPRFHIWRYLALIFFFVVISLNQTLVGYKDMMPLMGNMVYWIVSGTILVYILTVFVSVKITVKCLLLEKYMLFVSSMLLLAVGYTAIANIVFVSYDENYNFLSEKTIIDNLSSLAVYILCISGVIIPIFLRNWIVSNQQLSQLKVKQQVSQTEQLKAQLNPASFFKILNRSGALVKSEPDKASAMLMKLSQLLRYQLYDCNREQVFLSSEISFLRNFLDLEKLYSSIFHYTLNTEGNINGVFIPPSILLPYVQSVINTLDKNEDHQTIDVLVNNSDKSLCVSLKVVGITSSILLEKELVAVRERLNTLYKNQYELGVTKTKPIGKIDIVLQLYRI